MKRKLFVASDIHGHYAELMRALENAGFDKDNEEHIFVSCGDLFDRGRENLRVYGFVKALERKILIRGNHEDMLLDVFKRGKITVTEVYNGTDVTLEELIGEDAIDANGRFDKMAHAAKIREMTDFIASMEDYFETENYVFTHGWLPIAFDERFPHVSESWRSASAEEWKDARFLEWQQLYNVGALLAGKTIVCGHRPARMGAMFDSSREPDCSEPFYGDGMIAIDAGTVRSGRVNVLVIEE
ncbi:MAG: metallophosphoesterase [Clostridia bacterium]|nr:metallophosphoesterase [Clostridia bacterium]